MKTGKRTNGPATCVIRYSQLAPATQRGKLRELTALNCTEPGKGHGSKLLQAVCAEADAAGVSLLLTADSPELGRWYHKHGFRAIQDQPLVMLR